MRSPARFACAFSFFFSSMLQTLALSRAEATRACLMHLYASAYVNIRQHTSTIRTRSDSGVAARGSYSSMSALCSCCHIILYCIKA